MVLQIPWGDNVAHAGLCGKSGFAVGLDHLLGGRGHYAGKFRDYFFRVMASAKHYAENKHPGEQKK